LAYNGGRISLTALILCERILGRGGDTPSFSIENLGYSWEVNNIVNATEKLHIIPLGGVGEIGKNMMCLEYGDDIVVIDAGLAFPEEEMLGIDIVLPDIQYLLDNVDRVRAIVLTHGHEDHIGALPYVLRKLDVPIFATRLTLGLVRKKLEETRLILHSASREVKPGEVLDIGVFSVEFFRTTHSVADCVGLIISTPVGTVVHTGDFKFDHTPVDGERPGLHQLAEAGKRGVLVLLSDSTNATRPGSTPSERTVGVALEALFRQAEGRILMATFASNIHRIQQCITMAHRFGRKVAVVGRSMENTVDVSMDLGYLHAPPNTLLSLQEVNRLPLEEVVILTTGSQGEPLAALTRMSTDNHRRVSIVPGDLVIMAATPVPGNEKLVFRTINNLHRLGARVVHGADDGVHVSGHASREDLKLMLNLVQPDYFIPVHGEYRHLVEHARLAEELGVPEENSFVGDNGTVFEFTRDSGRVAGTAPAGEVLVDGLGVGDIGSIVLRDRHRLSEGGIVIVVVAIDAETGELLSGPEILTRGFVYVRESGDLLEEARERCQDALKDCEAEGVTDWGTLKSTLRDALGDFLYAETRRSPMILPIIMEVDPDLVRTRE